MRDFTSDVLPVIRALPVTTPIKVAVLDTGINFDRRNLRFILGGKIKAYRSWCLPNPPANGVQQMSDGNIISGSEDADGHGSHVVSTLLKVAPTCDVYVAKVFNDRYDLQNGETYETVGDRIAKVCDCRYVTVVPY